MGNFTEGITLPTKETKSYLKKLRQKKKPTALVSTEKQIISVNKPFLNLIRGSKSHILKTGFRNIIPRNQAQMQNVNSGDIVQNEVDELSKNPESKRYFFLQIKKITGELFWAKVRMRLVKVKNKLMFETMFENIPEPEQKEKEEYISKIRVQGNHSIFDPNDSSPSQSGVEETDSDSYSYLSVPLSPKTLRGQNSNQNSNSNSNETVNQFKKNDVKLEEKKEDSFIDLSSFIDDEVSEKVDQTKSIVRANEATDLERVMVPKLNKILELYTKINSHLDKQIGRMKRTILQEKKRFSTKIFFFGI
eukprot:Anaeramoba_ignava/c19066_g1_i1.p1 GENE.c19066_g1_i1~~c19066_g1_i1.p1  ORF type:complete len:305 (-),score=114.49 c19066_g1_i1:214-1128(-)